MTKAIALATTVVMLVQILRPLGLPGLRYRGDAWKIAVAGLAAFLLVALTKGSEIADLRTPATGTLMVRVRVVAASP